MDETWSEINGGSIPYNPSVWEHLEQGLLKSPHKPAVICMHQPANQLSHLVPPDNEIEQGDHNIDCLKLTYTQLHHAALYLAAGLSERGARAQSTVLSLLPNSGEYCLFYWTSVIMRLTFAAPDPTILEPEKKSQLQEVLETLKPGLIVVPDAESARALDEAMEGINIEKPLCIASTNVSNGGWRSLSDLIADGSDSLLDENIFLDEVQHDNPARVHSVLFTSGTSVGAPKGAPMRVGSMSHYLESQSWLINPDNCSLVLQPAHNSRAVAQAVMLQTWKEGGAVVIPKSSFSIEHTLEAITEHGVTWIVLTPAMVHALAKILPSHDGSIDSVKTIQVGGDMITKEVLTKCSSLFPNARTCINHGMTEGGGFFLWPYFDKPVSDIPFFGEICPIGTVAPGTKLRIWDSSRWRAKKRGHLGEMHVSCPSIITHYINGQSNDSFYEDGEGRWFKTGDVGMVTEKGLVYILGRSKDVIKRGRTPITPAVMESWLEKFTGAQTVVVGIEHPVLGHEPFAVLGDMSNVTEEQVQHEVLRTFGREFTLRGAASLQQLGFDKFPVNATHKVQKFEVQTAVEKYLKSLNKNSLDSYQPPRRSHFQTRAREVIA